MIISYFDLALLFIPLLASVYAFRHVRALGRAAQHQARRPITSRIEAEDVPQPVKDRLHPLMQVLEGAGYHFDTYSLYQSTHSPSSVIVARFRNDDGTVSASVVDQVGSLPPAIELDTLFADGMLMIVTAPYGEKVDTVGFHSRHAYDPHIALEYHAKQLKAMADQHGAPRVIVTEAEHNLADEVFHAKYAPLYYARQQQLMRTGAGMFVTLALAAWGLAALGIALDLPDATKLAIYGLLFAGFVAVVLVYRWLWHRYMRFPGAIDETLNADRKKKKA